MARDRGLIGRLLVLALVVLVAGCSGLRAPIIPGAAARAEAQRQTADSEENARIIAAYGGVYHDDKVEQAVAAIVSRIMPAAGATQVSYRVTLLNAASVNAFALPDGHLYVTRGLLALATDASEVAAVLAHEMGHVTSNHAAQREQKAKNTLIAQQAVTDVVSDEQSRQLALSAGERTLAAFSRQQELEADALGIKTIAEAGYDPYAAARFLSAMAKFSDYRSAVDGDGPTDFLATHPATPERVEFAQQSARSYGAVGSGDSGRDRYLAGVDGMVFGDDPSQGFVRDRRYYHPGLGITFSVPAEFDLDNSADAVLATGGDGTALRFDAVAAAGVSDVSAYLKSGWVNGLDAASIQTFAVNGFAAASARAQAKGWRFQIVVLQSSSGAIYRFIFANEADTAVFRRAANDTVGTFRALTESELANLKPLRVRLVTVAKGDTDVSLSRRMKGVERPRDLFDIINGIAPGTALIPGTQVKIITDG